MTALAFLFGALAITLLINIPLAFGLGMSGLGYILLFGSTPIELAAQRTIAGIDSFTLLAIPMFLLAGATMAAAGISARIIDLCSALVGSFRGGLAMVAVLAAIMFGALSGSGVADVTAIGALMLPHMKKAGYDTGFSCALIGCAGSLGTVIPPSIVLIVYGAMSGTSIGDLFVGGIVPGVLCGLALMLVAFLVSRRNDWGGDQPFSTNELLQASRRAVLSLFAPVIVVGGIRLGVFTPTEAAAIAFVYALFLGTVVYRTIDLKTLWGCLLEAVETTGAVLLIIASASLFAWVLAAEQVPQAITAFLTDFSQSPLVILMLLNVIILILGTFMEAIALIIILVPLTMPILAALGIDKVHFGIILALNLAIGANTPPLGIDLLAACRVGGIDLLQSLRPLVPMLGAMIAVLMLVTLFPALVVS